MKRAAIAGLALLVGGAVGSQLMQTSAASDAFCRCWKRDMPQWAAWQDTHDAYLCTTVLPKDQSIPAAPCSLWNTAPPMPTGFDVRLTP